ncbi:uncharacterized protein JCM6883_006661 [Sporobolomyces salmoneus]|uniref:uncharacterized protein n=1 Tax=Sporobolomyces salmoneus TaxID=183962 RepID=UPI00317191FF
MSLNSYIVVFKKPEEAEASDDHISECCSKLEKSGGEVKQRYTSKVMRGFAGTMSEDLKKEFESHPGVKYVEPDGAVSI